MAFGGIQDPNHITQCPAELEFSLMISEAAVLSIAFITE